MGVLKKKIKASTLMETLVATSILLIVFVVASLIVNTIFKNVVYNDTFGAQNRLEELHYLYKHKQITLPYEEDFREFTITINSELRSPIHYLLMEATSNKTAKIVTIESIDDLQ